VPEDVIEKMSKQLQPPTLEEGFDRVTVVNLSSISARATGRD
jgi:hypothetical protein